MKMVNIVICVVPVLLMCMHLCHSDVPEIVTVTTDFCTIDDSRRYELASEESKIIEWNGERTGLRDWDYCSFTFSGTDRKIADLEEWTLCVEAEKFSISNCDVEVEYRHGLIMLNVAKVYNCSTGMPEKFCTTEMSMRIIVTAPTTSSSNFRLIVSATEDKTDKIVEDVMFYVKIGLGAAAALLIVGSALVILCVYCHRRRSRNAYAGSSSAYQVPGNQHQMQSKPVNSY